MRLIVCLAELSQGGSPIIQPVVPSGASSGTVGRLAADGPDFPRQRRRPHQASSPASSSSNADEAQNDNQDRPSPCSKTLRPASPRRRPAPPAAPRARSARARERRRTARQYTPMPRERARRPSNSQRPRSPGAEKGPAPSGAISQSTPMLRRNASEAQCSVRGTADRLAGMAAMSRVYRGICTIPASTLIRVSRRPSPQQYTPSQQSRSIPRSA